LTAKSVWAGVAASFSSALRVSATSVAWDFGFRDFGCSGNESRVVNALMWYSRVLACAVVVLALSGCGGGGGSDTTDGGLDRFTHPQRCAGCHPRQYAEWQGSMMAYAAVSPVFNALEAIGNRLTGGEFASDGESALLCQRCHAPVSVDLREFPPFAETEGHPSRDFTGEVGGHGLSCDFCHQVVSADKEGSLLGDGIGNASYVLEPGETKFGPFADPQVSPFHPARPSTYLRSPQFCGSCHDVRFAGTDAVTGEGFLRLENLFTEWQSGPYATSDNPFGRVVSCQDCHMSGYPYTPPGTYFDERAATYGDTPVRSVSTHYFSGVDVALIEFPGQDDDRLDLHGLPIGQKQRREDLLRAACTIAVDAGDPVGGVLPLSVSVTNVGAGHNVPSGFSQERQVWIELQVVDAAGTLVYESGYLFDKPHPELGEDVADGNVDDEDLENFHAVVDPVTMEAHIEPGPDFDQRPRVQLGLVNFGNKFRRVGARADEEVLSPFLANHMDNSHSIAPLQTALVRYDVPLSVSAISPLSVRARLRFRAFPPHFLRALAAARPDLVDEALVDRNRIVEMAVAETTVAIAD